jgi:hypothetical protein
VIDAHEMKNSRMEIVNVYEAADAYTAVAKEMTPCFCQRQDVLLLLPCDELIGVE